MSDLLRAWEVEGSEPWGGSVVVFATSRGKAIRKARVELDSDLTDDEWTDMHAIRAKGFDDLASRGEDYRVTPRDYLERGWWMLCGACGRQLVASDAPAFDGEEALCQACNATRTQRAQLQEVTR